MARFEIDDAPKKSKKYTSLAITPETNKKLDNFVICLKKYSEEKVTKTGLVLDALDAFYDEVLECLPPEARTTFERMEESRKNS